MNPYMIVLLIIGERVASLKLGDPLDKASQMGPINSKAQYEKVLRYIEITKEEGASLGPVANVPQVGNSNEVTGLSPQSLPM